MPNGRGAGAIAAKKSLAQIMKKTNKTVHNTCYLMTFQAEVAQMLKLLER